MAAPTDPVDRLVDLVVFAPLGLALKAREELPKLAAHGRVRFTAQAQVARMVGQMTVKQALRQIQEVVNRRPSEPEAARPAEDAKRGRAVPIRDLGPDDPYAVVTPPAPAAQTGPPPDVADLPIPGYDSLSASQVVQRLAGLSRDELDAVRAYEQAGRNRQTILLRVAQLRTAS